jgi:hypothetical protein
MRASAVQVPHKNNLNRREFYAASTDPLGCVRLLSELCTGGRSASMERNSILCIADEIAEKFSPVQKYFLDAGNLAAVKTKMPPRIIAAA